MIETIVSIYHLKKEGSHGTRNTALDVGRAVADYLAARHVFASLDETAMPTSFDSVKPQSAVSWGAIIAGAVVAVAISLVLVALGSGLGLASVSPWADQGVKATTFTVEAVIWLIVMQWVSAVFGGYIVGRLRTRWSATHVHEIFFRDTAHGFVVWALATVVVAIVFASSLGSGISGGVKAAAAGPQGATLAYAVDKLFRPVATPTPTPVPTDAVATVDSGADARMEASRIVLASAGSATLSAADRIYLVGLVQARTGISNSDAQQRVDELMSGEKQAAAKVKAEADKARKGTAELSIYTALAMLIGAFIASVSAALGGRLRDESEIK